MKKKIEAEGGELIFRNDQGDVAIIPKNLAKKAQGFLDADDQDSLNNMIRTLPTEEDYAQDGTFLAGPTIEGEEKVTQIPKGEPIPKGMIDYDKQKRVIDMKAKGIKTLEEVAIGVGDLSKLSEKEKTIASSYGSLEEAQDALRAEFSIPEEKREEVFNTMHKSSPVNILEDINRASRHAKDAGETRANLIKGINDTKGFYKIKEIDKGIDSEGNKLTDRSMQALVSEYELAKRADDTPLYIRHWDKKRASGAPFTDTVSKEEFDTGVAAWKDKNKEPIYTDIPDESSLYSIKPEHVTKTY